eukprot:jgi/Tetstr1/462968/TSEL_007916.t1
MMPGPEWQILSYHVPGMPAFLPEVDHEDEARRRTYETARTMAAAIEMRHWNPEAHVGDDEYILADVKAAVDEAIACKTDEQEMRRVERINREGGFAGTAHALFGRAKRVFLSDVNPSRVSHFVADALSPETHDKAAAIGAPMRGGRGSAAPARGGRGSGAPARGGRGSGAPTRGGRGSAAPTRGGRGIAAPTRGGRGSGAPTRGGRGSAAPTRGGRGSAALTVTAHLSEHISK